MHMASRIAELEIRLNLSEDNIEELNRTVFRQQQQIDLLQAQLREFYRMTQPENSAEPRNPREEIPPHY
jgi:SlyX protein